MSYTAQMICVSKFAAVRCRFDTIQMLLKETCLLKVTKDLIKRYERQQKIHSSAIFFPLEPPKFLFYFNVQQT